MNIRHFFTKNKSWGKGLGVFFGFLAAGPLGAICGLLLGNFFDKGLQEHFSKPFWHHTNESNPEIKFIFFKSLFLILGHIAKNTGRVSKSSIIFSKKIMHDMQLNTKEIQQAQEFFNQGKQATFALQRSKLLIILKNTLSSNKPLLQLFITTVYEATKLDGFSIKNLNLLNNILQEMNIAPIHRQPDFSTGGRYNYSDYINNNYSSYKNYYSSNYSSNHSANNSINQINLEMAYQELGITKNANITEVKRAYRKLISKHHPDRCIAQGFSEDQIKAANEKTQKIRKAYEKICNHIK